MRCRGRAAGQAAAAADRPAAGRRRRGGARRDAECDSAAVRVRRPPGRRLRGAAGGVLAAARLGHIRPVHPDRRAPAAAGKDRGELAARGWAWPPTSLARCWRALRWQPPGRPCRSPPTPPPSPSSPSPQPRSGVSQGRSGLRTAAGRPLLLPAAGRPQPTLSALRQTTARQVGLAGSRRSAVGAHRAARPHRRLLLPVRARRSSAPALRNRAAPRQRRAARPVLDCVRDRSDRGQHRRWPDPPAPVVAGPRGGGHRLGRCACPDGLAAATRASPGLLRRRRPPLCAVPALSATLFQRESPAELLSQVLAARGALTVLASPVGTALGGPLTAWLDAQQTLLISAAATIATCLAATAVLAIHRRGLDRPGVSWWPRRRQGTASRS
jgi:hypothetical protein